jgi:MerR family transcriptional regulator, mercuric resistance operon regulatory protein
LGGHRRYPAEAVTVLRVIKAAQRVGFTLGEVTDLLDAGRCPHSPRSDAGLHARAQAKLAEVAAKIADLQLIAGALRAAIEAGCEDLVACAGEPCCPIPFAAIAGELWMRTLADRPPDASLRLGQSRRPGLRRVLRHPGAARRRRPGQRWLGSRRCLDTRHRRWFGRARQRCLVVARRHRHRGGCAGGTSCACGV